jgi:hypothetical protein
VCEDLERVALQERELVLPRLDAEVAWILPKGPRPYWRGRLERVHYEFAT